MLNGTTGQHLQQSSRAFRLERVRMETTVPGATHFHVMKSCDRVQPGQAIQAPIEFLGPVFSYDKIQRKRKKVDKP